MEEIHETYDLETIEQLRAIADPLRTRIYQALTLQPMTATQVAEELDEPAPKMHYHVRELERVGLVRQVETRERGGILEKYFRARARGLRVPPSLLQQAPPDELAATMTSFLNSITSEFQTAMRRLLAQNVESFDTSPLTLSGDSVWMTPEEFKRAITAVVELFKPYYERRGIEDEREISLNIIGYETRLGRQSGGDAAMLRPAPPTPPRPPTLPMTRKEQSGSKTRKVVVAGAVTYSRRELQDMADRGERIDLMVIGMLAFSDDVTADLIERVIQRAKYYGALTAPDAVREALKAKEA